MVGEQREVELVAHQARVAACRRCPHMIGPPVLGSPAAARILLIGQAPGPKEGELGRPFAWTAGRTLFNWLGQLGASEAEVRERVYLAAVCRCFPGKKPRGGDRVPTRDEIAACSQWLAAEAAILRPELVIPVGRLAIASVLPGSSGRRLDDVVGRLIRTELYGAMTDVVALPHPSGLSTWFKVEPGKTLLGGALSLLDAHPAWRTTFPRAGEANDVVS
ncbi:MAG: uracil-DNA glycosylase family protein [Thermoleophilia bacterium]